MVKKKKQKERKRVNNNEIRPGSTRTRGLMLKSKRSEYHCCEESRSFIPVGCEDVQGWRLLARLEGLLHRNGQRRAVKQLLVLNGGAPESLPHGDVLKRHWGSGGEGGHP